MPGLSFTGGIQNFCQTFLKAIEQNSDSIEMLIFLKNDAPASHPERNHSDYRYFGHLPSVTRTFYFVIAAFIAAVRTRPNLIIVGHANFAVLAALLKYLFGIPYCVIVYGLEVWDERGTRVGRFLRSADTILSISQFTRDKLIRQQHLDPQRFVILPTTFDESRFRPMSSPEQLRNKLGLKQNTRVLLTVCRLEGQGRYKGYDQIIRALKIILEVLPETHYVIVGEGNDEGRIRKLIAELHLENNVALPGFVPDEALVDYYNLCDVFAMPSKQEGFGIVYLEALACGKPVLAGNKDGALDALRNGEFGVLVDPDDVDAIAQTLIQMLQQSYPHPLIYQPELLRQHAIEAFGFERYRSKIALCLSPYLY